MFQQAVTVFTRTYFEFTLPIGARGKNLRYRNGSPGFFAEEFRRRLICEQVKFADFWTG